MRLADIPRWLLAALLLGSSLARAAPSFREQLEAYARHRSLSVDWISSARLDEDPAPEHLARLCNPREPASSVYVLEQEPGVLWGLDAPPEQLPCPSKPPRAKPLPSRLELSRKDGHEESRVSLAFREGQPVFVASSRSSPFIHGSGSSTEEKDWEGLRSSMTFSALDGEHGLPVDSEDSRPPAVAKEKHITERFEGAILPVLASPEAAAALPPTFNHVHLGREHWTGEKDASVRVTAFALNADTVRLRIQVRDDRLIPAAEDLSNTGLLGVDHLKIQWGYDPRLQLVVARTEQGGPLVHWNPPPGSTEPPPTVAFDRSAFLVDLPLSSLRVNPRADSWQKPFSVIFSDSDAPGTAPQTQIALGTLQARWAGWTSVSSRLVSHPDHARYPPVSTTAFGRISRLSLEEPKP
ncbi:hypothetical protein JQX13_39725 [Archangium violaceum]|uniref:hypothetical protein n=1 Tax=Archangium violaceum TaxID=83451 RepID=UPI00193B4D8A|nr:hypothetical protein [Archangium violaceum]QRK06193.1 hypothetical protein JQX13_39725 [Archangium violaceum]